jgi:cytochrome c oxidase subunit 3
VVSEAHAHAPAVHHHDELLQHQFDDMEQQRECFSLGMWLFLATEIMMFGGLFFAYSFYRWKFAGGFHVGSSLLDTNLGTVNTFVLLASSMTMAMAVHAAEVRNKNLLLAMLALTWLFGAAFIGIKAVEWTKDWHEGLVPGLNWSVFSHPELGHHVQTELAKYNAQPHDLMMYFVIYFCMAGLHAIHMIVGLIIVGALIIYAARGIFTNGNDQPVEISGLYWHLIDIIWVFLFPLLYLIAGWHPFKGAH